MPEHVNLEGTWPAPIQLTRAWSRAFARPWNDQPREALLRLDRGTQDFLKAATRCVHGLGASTINSPALYPGSTRIWRRAGYVESNQLKVMERSLSAFYEPAQRSREMSRPDWNAIHELDHLAFEGFWRMSELGLREAMKSTNKSGVLTIQEEDELVGYALLGTQWGVAYLQRIAVRPDQQGRDLGRDLLRGGFEWARRHGAQTMVLNVRLDNDRASSLYESERFVEASTRLSILTHQL